MPAAIWAAKRGSLRHSGTAWPSPAATTAPAMPTPGGSRTPTISLAPAPQAAWNTSSCVVRSIKAIDAAASHFGKLDALINIAGGFAFEAVAEGDPKTWQRMYALNVTTALNASRAAIPHLTKATAGRIINIGAMGALQAGAGMGAYAASKAGVHRLTEALAAEQKGKITVNAVLPSIIDTAPNRASMPKADFTKWVAPKELAEVILFLASDAASAVTGALLPVTGRV